MPTLSTRLFHALSAFGLTSALYGQTYTVTNLNIDAQASQTILINQAGDIAGVEGTSLSHNCFRIRNGVKQDLPLYNGQSTELYGFNSADTVVGYSGASAWLYDSASFGSLGPSSLGAAFTDINDSGVCVGGYTRQVSGSNRATPCSYSAGAFTALPLPTGYLYGRANSVNSSGLAGGGGGGTSSDPYDHAMLWSSSGNQLLSNPDATYHNAQVIRVNGAGDYLLSAIDDYSAGHPAHLYLNHNGGYTRLTLPDGTDFQAFRLKDDLTMLGSARVNGVVTTFVRKPDGTYINISDIVHQQMSTYSGAFTVGDINASGQIVGRATGFSNGFFYSYMLLNPAPVPEPNPMWLIGLLGITFLRSKQKKPAA